MGLANGDPELDRFDLEPTFFENLRVKFQDAVTTVFGREVKANTSHAQKWDVGGFASAHSDNSDFEGKPSSFQINKYVGILYLNGDYEGGNLFFRDHGIEFKPTPYSFITFPGGIENVHGVTEITKGTRYTMVSFWDFAESEYSEEIKAEWDEELKVVRAEQELQRQQWDKGNKFA
jgi:predicted 2-oxoglutarate/Fe(II)-dependent dioxygenase YbiX